MVDSAKKQVPIKEGMMKLPQSPSDKGSLIGCKCRKCGQLFFVKRDMCENCQSQDLEKRVSPVGLAGVGSSSSSRPSGGCRPKGGG